MDVFVVACREGEEKNPAEEFNMEAGLYIEQLQDQVHSVKRVLKGNSTSKTDRVRLIQEAKNVLYAHHNRESLLTRIDILTEAIAHRYIIREIFNSI